MTGRQRQIQMNVAAFLLLFSVSLYRQLSLHYLPHDPFRTYLLYACYVLLIGGWAVSIYARVTQRSMRICLLMEAVVMLTGLTIRFLQDTFWQHNIPLMRVSGLYVAATLLPMVLLGLYASLGTGRADGYHIAKRWYVLLFPVLVMTYFTVTDESRHFMYYVILGEPQPNLAFHPSTGTFLLSAMGISLIVLRVFMIYRRNKDASVNRFLRFLIPFFEPLLMFLFSLEYFLVSLQLAPALAGKEVIELYTKIYYVEVLTWEFYIFIGLVPSNTQYLEIFEQATIGMQIIAPDGTRLSSRAATDVSPAQLKALQEQSYIVTQPGWELHAHPLSDGLFLWNKDVSALQSTIDQLSQSAQMLAQEGVLLNEEMKTKHLKASLLSKNQIYDELTKEVQGQLRLMKETIRNQTLREPDDKRLRKLVLLGTYVKRRCNLCLIRKETGDIQETDLRLSLEDMISAMDLAGIHGQLIWDPGRPFSPDFSIYLFDILEAVLEQVCFDVETLRITRNDGSVQLAVTSGAHPALTGPPPINVPEEYQVTWWEIPGGYLICLAEGGM